MQSRMGGGAEEGKGKGQVRIKLVRGVSYDITTHSEQRQCDGFFYFWLFVEHRCRMRKHPIVLR